RALDVVMTDRFAAYVDRWPEWRAESVAGVAHLRDVDVAALDDAGLGGHFNDIMEFSLPVYDLHFLLHGIGAMMLTDLVRTCQELLGWDEARALERLCGVASSRGNATSRRSRRSTPSSPPPSPTTSTSSASGLFVTTWSTRRSA